jgi:Zn-dependent protease
MLLVAVVLAAVVGIVFAAPGATMISGTTITPKQSGKISAAGPLINLILCIPFAIILFVSSSLDPAITYQTLLSLIGMVGLQVNAMIAAFNMLPVSVLDGRKVLAWNPVIFIVLIVASFGILIATFYPLIL